MDKITVEMLTKERIAYSTAFYYTNIWDPDAELDSDDSYAISCNLTFSECSKKYQNAVELLSRQLEQIRKDPDMNFIIEHQDDREGLETEAQKRPALYEAAKRLKTLEDQLDKPILSCGRNFNEKIEYKLYAAMYAGLLNLELPTNVNLQDIPDYMIDLDIFGSDPAYYVREEYFFAQGVREALLNPNVHWDESEDFRYAVISPADLEFVTKAVRDDMNGTGESEGWIDWFYDGLNTGLELREAILSGQVNDFFNK
ncbi:MAG: hypothetical protein ABIJ34_05125 [archaeon]